MADGLHGEDMAADADDCRISCDGLQMVEANASCLTMETALADANLTKLVDKRLRRRARNERYRKKKGQEPEQKARVAASSAKYRRGKGQEHEQKVRVAASSAKYRKGKGQEPGQKARVAASSAKYRKGKGQELEQKARVAASSAKYRSGPARSEENQKKCKASRKAYVRKLKESDEFQAKRRAWNAAYRDGGRDDGQVGKRKSAKAQYFKRRAHWQKTDEIVQKIQTGLLQNIPDSDSEDECREQKEGPLTLDKAAALARHYAALYEKLQVLFLAEMEVRTARLASKCTNALQLVASNPDEPPRKVLLEPCVHRSTAMS